MVCSNCGTENRPGRKFCGGCAAPLAVLCPSCGAANEPEMRFCGECATPLVAGEAPAAPTTSRPGPPTANAAPVAERRLVSILFADLVGFTTLAEGRDAEETRELLSRYFDLSREVIGRYGGTVEKFIGDAVMAVWGAPVAREDDAERAVRAGLELVDAVRALGPSLQARAGVLTGEAAVTLGATNQGMVAGDLVNTASRLQSVAAPGAVLVGEATERAASRAIAFEPAGEQTLKGKATPVPAWRALRVIAQRGGRNRTETLEAPFVGRDDELRLLKDLFHATTRERRARLVSVTGPTGIGKTRLAWEFLKYVDGLVEEVWWHAGRSPAYGDGISFWALGEMVRGRCGLLEPDDEATTRAKVADTLATHVPDPDERRWIEPALLALLGIDAGVSSEQLFGAWRTFFERLAATAPVVLVFEDHHYADAGLHDFVDHLLEWSKGVPVYVLTLSRPDLPERRPDTDVGRRNFASLYLDPLPERAMRELLAGLVPGLPEQAARSIVARADGIPLYAVETVRMLLAQGKLTLENGAYRPTGDLTTLAVPETLTALIASRLDGLASDERSLVADAAVLGQSFTLAGLSAVSGSEKAELEPRLRDLVRRELLTLDMDPRSPGCGQYVFVQALIREVAYNALAKRDRKARHLAAARYFESLGSDELAGALAGHYLAAHQNAPEGPEADALATQARLALRGAAVRAAALGSHDQAVTFLELALTIGTDPAEQADLLELAGESASAAAHHAAAESFLERALALRRASGDRLATARATASLGDVLIAGHQTERAVAILEPAAAELADLAPAPAVVGLVAQLARAYFLELEDRRALEAIEPVLEAAEHADLGPILADALVTKGSALANVGRVREGIGVIETGERLARAGGLLPTILRGLNNRIAYQQDFDLPAYVAGAHEGLAMARRVGDRGMALMFGGHLGWGLWLTGAWDAALEALNSGLAEDPEPGDQIVIVAGNVYVEAARGAPTEAEVAKLATLAAKITDPQVLWSAVDAPAFVAFAAGRLAEAGEAWREMARRYASSSASYPLLSAARTALWLRDDAAATEDLVAIDRIGFHTPVVDARRTAIQAGLAALEERTGEAAGLFQDALRRLRELGMPFDEGLTAIDMAMMLDPAAHDVRAATDAAREILERLGAVPFIARLDAALARSADRTGRSVAPQMASLTRP